jgi:7,8-dihydropterin-6-yl-methyl-4-(beta-D-ribofuranosyl)aminobenzene 5'-phosphate synthase
VGKAFLLSIISALSIITSGNLIFFAHSMGAFTLKPAFKETTSAAIGDLRITVVYDNNPYNAGLTTSWGFACVIKGAEKTILFDTGGNSAVLLKNMQQLEINPKEIDVVVLSHIHGDHVGGLNGFLQEIMAVTVYLPTTFPSDFKESLKRAGVKTVEVNDPARISQGVYSTGVLGTWVEEQALIVSTDRGLIVITGCAHPGILHILQTAKKVIEKKILLVIGGFHLGAMPKVQLDETIAKFREMGVVQVGPCHCTGELARQTFKQEYGKDYLDVGVGRLIEFDLKR